jgi:hypothetical protein|nr:MAG TPA: hypothetical protein [Microviridae sp.]
MCLDLLWVMILLIIFDIGLNVAVLTMLAGKE